MSSPYTTMRHATAWLRKCGLSREDLNDLPFLRAQFSLALEACKTRVIGIDGHRFEPEGVTLTAILADSHAVLHTWPEEAFVMVEIFTCGHRGDPMGGIRFLVGVFKPRSHEIQDTISRI
ncbi:MAG: adenosylmethionine decarboxylase [Candidatus Lokiarchaeota archaeon]|nr:adenosylmethionine decarboxylase [Candidatus Lokiarchaeota archaeon]